MLLNSRITRRVLCGGGGVQEWVDPDRKEKAFDGNSDGHGRGRSPGGASERSGVSPPPRGSSTPLGGDARMWQTSPTYASYLLHLFYLLVLLWIAFFEVLFDVSFFAVFCLVLISAL